MAHHRFHGVILCAIGALTACSPDGRSELRSLLGLEAGQDQEIRSSTNAVIYVALSDWFQSFRASANGGNKTLAAGGLSSRIPAASTELMRAYLSDQLKRHQDFESALDQKDDVQIAKLLDLETLEMKDIALSLISDSPAWQPPSGDKLAQIIVASRRHSSFADRFAATGFLAPLLKNATTAQLVRDAETQRKNYLSALAARYVGDPSRHAALRERISKNYAVMSTMLQSLDKPANASSLALGDDGASNDVDGPAAVMLGFLTSGHSEANQKNKAYGAASGATIHQASNDIANAEAPQDAQSLAESTLINNPFSAIKAQNQLYAPFFDAAPPDLTFAFSATHLNNGTSTDTSSSTSTATSSTNAVTTSSSNGSKPYKVSSSTFVSDSDAAAIARKASFNASSSTFPLVAEPAVDCTRMNLSGRQIVDCQRTLAYANTKLTTKQPSSLARTKSSSLTAATENHTALIKAFIIQGSTDSGEGDITQQGSVGACTLHGMHSALRMNLRQQGVDPNSVLIQTGSEINNLFNTTQGAQPYMTAAVNAASEHYSNKLNINATEISSWDEARELLVKNARPLFIGINISQDWMSNGGGDEFGLTDHQDASSGDALALAGSLTKLTCGGVGGHAVAIVGFIGNDPIIKNSWGADWGHGGLALIDGASCLSGNYHTEVYDVEVSLK